MIYLGIFAVIIAIMCATFIVHSGYEGGYDDVVVGIMVQTLFVISFCAVFYGFGIFKMTWLYVGIALSFALLGVGYLAWRRPFSDMETKQNNIARAKIRRTKQYKEYKDQRRGAESAFGDHQIRDQRPAYRTDDFRGIGKCYCRS